LIPYRSVTGRNVAGALVAPTEPVDRSAHEGRGYIRIPGPVDRGAHEGRGYIRPYTRTVASRPRNVTVEVAAMSGA
jgi:hypothetical protein